MLPLLIHRLCVNIESIKKIFVSGLNGFSSEELFHHV